MADELSSLEALGRDVARAQDHGLARQPLPDPGVVADRWAARRGGVQRRWVAPVLGVAALIAFLSAWALYHPQRPTLAFSVGEAGRPGELGELLSSRDGLGLTATFTDGTRIALDTGARARVQELRPDGADLVVEGGRATFDVVPSPAHLWRVSVGPFTVLVTGTRFATTWRPDAESFELSLFEGAVGVTGCGFDRRLDVRAGETLRASCHPFRYEVLPTSVTVTAASARPAGGVPPSDAPRSSPAIDRAPAPVARETRSKDPPTAAHHETAPAWRASARAGRYAEAMSDARARGFSHECEEAPATDLKALADAAYLTGQVDDAERAYKVLRRRFPGTALATSAAYSLGRLEFDSRGAHKAAARWFRTVLEESPAGPLAREALGRLVEALHRSSDPTALDAARSYLDRYPTGPHAETARRVSGGSR